MSPINVRTWRTFWLSSDSCWSIWASRVIWGIL